MRLIHSARKSKQNFSKNITNPVCNPALKRARDAGNSKNTQETASKMTPFFSLSVSSRSSDFSKWHLPASNICIVGSGYETNRLAALMMSSYSGCKQVYKPYEFLASNLSNPCQQQECQRLNIILVDEAKTPINILVQILKSCSMGILFKPNKLYIHELNKPKTDQVINGHVMGVINAFAKKFGHWTGSFMGMLASMDPKEFLVITPLMLNIKCLAGSTVSASMVGRGTTKKIMGVR